MDRLFCYERVVTKTVNVVKTYVRHGTVPCRKEVRVKDETIYSVDDITKTYKAVSEHIDTRGYIRRYSENREDIRDVALRGLDVRDVQKALDLGCSYGFFTEKLVRYLGREADITGIDLIEEGNRESFLRILREEGLAGRFIAGRADHIRAMADGSFDLVVASYSLYFFPHLIGDISRILKPDGIFIALTHTEDSLKELIGLIPLSNAGGDTLREPAISRLFRVFSMENGEVRLKEHFGTIERIPYLNKLVFPYENIEDCYDYVSKKRNLIFKEVRDTDPQRLDGIMEEFFRRIQSCARQNRVLEITKDDCVFRCRDPLWHGSRPVRYGASQRKTNSDGK